MRAATAADLAAVRACVDAAYDPYRKRMATAPAPLLDDYAALIDRGVVAVALLDDAVIGAIVTWPENDHLYVDNIAVHPDAQGSGVGSTLLAHAEQMARRLDHTQIRLYTNEVMTENLEYYPRRGFVETHRALDAGYHRVFFTKHL